MHYLLNYNLSHFNIKLGMRISDKILRFIKLLSYKYTYAICMLYTVKIIDFTIVIRTTIICKCILVNLENIGGVWYLWETILTYCYQISQTKLIHCYAKPFWCRLCNSYIKQNLHSKHCWRVRKKSQQTVYGSLPFTYLCINS